MELITHGFNQAPIASLGLRLAAGAFFAISGYHKCTNVVRRNTLKQTFIADGVYSPAMMWIIPCAELLGGIALIAGFLTVFAAAGLILLLCGACFLDGLKRIPDWKPLDKADYIDDVLYLPEITYILILGSIILIGPGSISVDAMLF